MALYVRYQPLGIAGGSGASFTVGPFGSTPNNAGLDLTAGVLTLEPADATHPGALSTGTQSIAGQKTFTTGLTGTLTGSASLNVLTSALGNLTDVGTDGITVTGGTGAVVGTVSLAQQVADATHNGYLSSADWNTFNSKQAALTLTNLTDVGTDGITITNGTGAVVGASPVTISQHVADATHSGYLSSTDWNTFDGKTSGGITSLTGAITASGPGAAAVSITSQTGTGTTFVMQASPTLTTPVIGAATGTSLSVSGQLTSTVATGTPPLVVSSTTQVANLNAATAGSATTATTATNLAGGLGGSIPYQSAASTTAMLANGSAGKVLTSAGTTLAPTWETPTVGTVTSVAMTVPGGGVLSVTGSPISTSGTLALGITGTSGGIPYFSSASNLETSAALSADVLVIGGGAGTAPHSLAAGTGGATQVLHGNGAGPPSWSAVSLTADVTGTLPIANGGTNAGTANAAFNNLSPMTTGGDLIYGGASGVATRLANGAAGQVLTSAGTTLAPTWSAASTGTVTSVGAAGPTGIATWSSAVTGSGTLTQTLSTQAAGTFFAGPTSGSAAVPSFRALQAPTISKATAAGTASGTGGFASGTYTTPAGALYLRVRMCGGGSGGSGSGTASQTAGGAGGTTFFRVGASPDLLVANGGNAPGSISAGGTGGTASLGSGPTGTNLTGGSGCAAANDSLARPGGGIGGTNAFGGAGAGGTVLATGGAASPNTGAGGGGGGGPLAAGSSGGGGGSGGFIDAIISSPSATYSYSVGAAGTAGGIGTGGAAGGLGGLGYIEVTEYYQ